MRRSRLQRDRDAPDERSLRSAHRGRSRVSATASPEDMDAYIVAGIISGKFDGLTVEEVAARMTDSWGEDAEQRVLRALGRFKVISESDPSTRVLTSVGGVLRVAQRDPRDDESWTPR
jgi:hypothetical protein